MKTSMGHLMCPALFLPKRRSGAWLMIFWIASIIEGHFIARSFHSDDKVWVLLNIYFHRRSIVSYAQGQYAVVK